MDSCPDTDIDPNEGEVSPHIPSGKTSRVYLRISQHQTKVELVFSVYISILLLFCGKIMTCLFHPHAKNREKIW